MGYIDHGQFLAFGQDNRFQELRSVRTYLLLYIQDSEAYGEQRYYYQVSGKFSFLLLSNLAMTLFSNYMCEGRLVSLFGS